ncbi:MAG: DnaD domain protein [Mogibacterium sp.]|nr:DnaD domain protein [Mogibacterium sp.]
MAKIRLSLEDKKDIFLCSTEIENLVISEFLPDAPGDYVKVYLFGLMYASYGQDIDTHKMAHRLGLSEEETEEAWIYWESRGLVKLGKETGPDGEVTQSLVFVSQVEQIYGNAAYTPQADAPAAPVAADTADEEEDSGEDVPLYLSIDDMEFDEVMSSKLVDKRLRALFEKYQVTTGRTISRQETSKIEDAIKVYGIEPEIFDFAIDYCADLEKYSIDYIFKVALRWTEEGCRTVEDAKRLLDKHSKRNSWYRQVFNALGFTRLPAPADREIMDRWFDELGCSIGEVLDACAAAAGLRDPNLRYVNKVIENHRLEKGGVDTRLQNRRQGEAQESGEFESGSKVSRKVLNDYFEYIRKYDSKALEARRAEVLRRVPEMGRLFEAEKSINAKLLSMRPGGADQDAKQRLRAERIGIEERKKQLLAENGFPVDHLTRKYRCDKCRDTGYTDEGMVCSCCRQRAEEAYKWYTEKDKGVDGR